MIHLPLTYNDRSPIEPEKIGTFLVELEDLFGGYTVSRASWDGFWKDGEEEYRDRIRIIFIDGADEIKTQFERISIEYTAYLGQKKIYITYYDVQEL